MENWSDFKNTNGVKEYIRFLERSGYDIYYIKDFPWLDYHGYLQPCILDLYEPPRFGKEGIEELIKKVKLPFIRWSSNFTDRPTKWWWVIREAPFSIDTLSSKARNQVKRSLKNCSVRIIEPLRLASSDGYGSYVAACKSRKQTFSSRKKWEEHLESHTGYDIFQFWGIFLENKIIGHAQCILINKRASVRAIWYDPAYLNYYPVYALIFSILDYYLGRKKCLYVSNGTRSIAHDTQMQEFLMRKFNFEKKFCKLNVVYSSLFGSVVRIAYLFRAFISLLTKFSSHGSLFRINTIIKQEAIRRSFVKNYGKQVDNF